MADRQAYWFPAKRYGWGWGWPLTWQGWAVLIGFIGLLGIGILIFIGEPAVLLAYIAILSALLVAICWWKGEPPRWRWGRGEGA